MAFGDKSTREIARKEYTLVGSKDGVNLEQIRTANAIDIAQSAATTATQTERCARLLESILNRLDTLGRDGIHDLVRLEATRVRKLERARKKRAAARRRATIARKKLAAAEGK